MLFTTVWNRKFRISVFSYALLIWRNLPMGWRRMVYNALNRHGA